jgi:hypothetical protein
MIPLLVVACLFASPVIAQDKENPIEKEVKASLKDPAKPFIMIIQVKIKDGTGPALGPLTSVEG